MTLKVTISVDKGQSYKAVVKVQDATSLGPLTAFAQEIPPGEVKDFYITTTRYLEVHELPL